jgi:hypothetical protein
MEATEGRLEAAVADMGVLLIQVDKYRRGAGPDAAALHRAVLTLGDAARRLHRRDRLDPSAAARLLAEAAGLLQRLRDQLAAIRDAPEYRAALVAKSRGDPRALADALVTIFAGLEVVPRPPDLYHAVAWLRRGRPRPAADVAAEVSRAQREGLAADADDLARGVDPALPAVALTAEPPAGEPIVLRLPAGAAPAPICRLADTGDYLVHVERLRGPFTVLLRATLDPDTTEEVPVDYPTYRAEILAALSALGIPVETE